MLQNTFARSCEMPPALRRLVHRELDKNLAGIPEAQLPGVVRHELSLQ